MRPPSLRNGCMLASPVSSAKGDGTPTEVAAAAATINPNAALRLISQPPGLCLPHGAGDCQIPQALSIAACVARSEIFRLSGNPVTRTGANSARTLTAR